MSIVSVHKIRWFLISGLVTLLSAPSAAQAQTVSFAMFGDFGDASTAEGDVADLVNSLGPDFIVTTGDNTYSGGANGWDPNVGAFYGSYIAYPGGSTSAYAPGSPTNRFFPALGNHDWDETGYENYFDLPGAGIPTSGTSGTERYYDFVQGPVHFFVIDSDGREPDGITSVSTQAQWLQAQLAASTAPWKLVVLHHPPFSSSSNHGNTPALQWPFEAWGATAAFAGHDHTYERIIRDDNSDGTDFPYFVTGLGGRSIYNFNATPEAGSQVRYNGNYGTMLVTATSATINFEFYSIDGGGTLIDSYTMTNDNLVCEAFDDFAVGSNVGTDADWFDSGSGPNVNAAGGVGGSQGLDDSGTIFTWTANPINWNDPNVQGLSFQLDLQTDGSGNFDDDRVGWMISDNSSSSDNIFGVQLDPGGGGQNIEGYWDGVSFGDDGGRPSIVTLPALSANTFYRLRADFTKLTATSVRIDVVLTELDGAGAEVGVVATGTLTDTDLLSGGAGEALPNAGYFTAPLIWPGYKNHSGLPGAADNACFAVLTEHDPGPGPDLAAGDVIISGFQSWNSVGADNPAEFIELFNTTGETISLEGMQLFLRVDTDANGSLDTDWQLTASTVGASIAPYSFFLIAESDVDAEGGVRDITTDLDLATGEGGATERAIGLELIVGGVHMDHVLYGRSDGTDTAGIPDGDIPFGGVYPRDEVIRNTRGTSSFQEGVAQRLSQEDLFAGHAVNGFYTDEAALPGSNPAGVWTSPHDETDDGYQARSSFSAAVPPPATPLIAVTGTPLNAFSSPPAVPSAEQSYTVEGSTLTDDITIMAPADFEVSTTSGSGFSSMVVLPQSGGAVAPTTVYVRFNRPTGGVSGGDITHTSFGAPQVNVPVSGVAQPALSAGSIIIAGIQSWNDPGADSPGEFIELFNTTSETIFLDNLEIISRVDTGPDGTLDVDWQLSASTAGMSIAPHSFFLIAESDVDAVGAGNGLHDLETDMDLATGEGGVADRAIGVQVLVDGVHMDHVLYGRADGSDTAGIPDGDIPFGGTYPRIEVIRNTTGSDNFQDGYLRRVSAEDLYAGYDVNGFYKDEASLPGDNPAGVWTSDHDEENDDYEARNSTTAAVPPPAPIPPDPPTGLAVTATSHSTIDLSWTDASTNENGFEVERSDDGASGTFSLLVSLPAGTESYTDTDLDAEEDYCYRVRAVNVYGPSGYTTEECATTDAAPLRVVDDLLVLYTFEEGTGTIVNDLSGVGTPLNLSVTSGAPTWDIPGALNVSAPALLTSGATATKIIAGVQASNELTVEAWVTPANLTQFGPARIAAISGGATVGSNMVLGPGPGPGDMTKYDARLRTTATNKYGNNPSLTTADGQVTTSLTHVVYTRDAAGTTAMYVNGAPVAAGSVGGNLSSWANYALTLANEPTNDRPWLGALHLVAMYSRALTPVEVAQNFGAGEDGEGSEPTYTLTVNVAGNGTVQKNPDQAQYDQDEVVELTAVAGAGWVFSGWSGDLTGSDNPESIVMNSNKTVTATFTEIPTYTLSVVVVGNGTVARDPDKAQYDVDEVVDLTATADPGWLFTGWSGDLTGVANPESITMDADKTVTATFSEISTELAGLLVVEEVASGGQIGLEFGTDGSATDATDAAFDVVLPPPPPDLLDARFVCNSDNAVCTDDLLIDYRGLIAEGQTIVWRLQFRRETASSDVNLDWGGTTFPPTGTFALVDPLASFADVDMRSQSSFTVTNDAITEVRIVYDLAGTSTSFEQTVAEGWNLIGLPLSVADNDVTVVYPSAVGGTLFSFDPSLGYESETTLDLGAGYWLRFGADGSETVNGDEVTAVSINVAAAGWHLISGPSCSVGYGAIVDNGGILIPNTLYGFNGAAYTMAGSVDQGNGYWVKTSDAGQLQLACAAAKAATRPVASTEDVGEEGFGILAVRDASGAEQRLLFGAALTQTEDIASYSLPPVPPRGAFDARFAGDTRLVQQIDAEILVQSSRFPLAVEMLVDPSDDGSVYVLEVLAESVVVETHAFAPGSIVTISDAEVTGLRLAKAAVEEVEIPASFGLRGSYPNPFAEMATILVDVPEEADVEVVVIDVLGRVVQTLPERTVPAGSSQALQFVATPGLASGTYFYRVTARTATATHVQTGRMTLAR